MYEYEIVTSTNEHTIIHGYSLANAMRRANLDPTEQVQVLWYEYID